MSDQPPSFPPGPPISGDGAAWPPPPGPAPAPGWGPSAPPSPWPAGPPQGWQPAPPPPPFGAPPGGVGPGQPWSSGSIPPKPNSGAGVIVAVVVIVLIIGVGGVTAALLLGRSSANGTESASSAPTISSTPASSATTAPATTEAGGQTSESGPGVPAGYKRVSDDAKGYAFVVPTSWETGDLTKEKLDELINTAKDTNPQLAATLESFQATIGAGGLAFGYDTSAAPTDAVPSLDLIAIPSGGLTADQVAAQLDLGLGAVNATIVSKEKVKVDGKDGVLVALKVGSGAAAPVQHQLYLASGGKMYVFTVGNADDATTNNILRSLEVR